MGLRRLNKRTWVPTLVLTALGISESFQQPCHGQKVSAEAVNARVGWVPLSHAVNTTANTGLPTLVIVTSPSKPASLQLCRALTRLPEAAALAGSIQFAEMASDVYKDQVKALGVNSFPTLIVYSRSRRGIEIMGRKSGLTEPGQVVPWLRTLGLASKGAAPADPALARAGHYPPAASGQAYPTEQAPPPYAPPKQPIMAPPLPPYVPPAPPPQAPPQYVAPYPAQAPVYVQPSAPAMIVQQAPQQIVLAPRRSPRSRSRWPLRPGRPCLTLRSAAPRWWPAHLRRTYSRSRPRPPRLRRRWRPGCAGDGAPGSPAMAPQPSRCTLPRRLH